MSTTEQAYVNIGHTKKAHGLSGELKFSISEEYLEDFLKNERIFLSIKSSKIPYFIANVRGKGELIVHLEDVDSRTAAEALQSKEIFLREQDILQDQDREIEIVDDSLEYEGLTGFIIVDQTIGEVGLIDEVLEMPQQEMAFLKFKNREVLIPLNKDLILEIDEKNQRVLMDLPEGLLDM